MKDALIVFAKVPQPGAVKTRLVPPLTPEAAADLYAAMLADALAAYAALGPDVRLYLPPSEARLDAALWTGETFVQRGPDLGARMLRAFAETFAADYDRVVIVGTDHPTLPTDFLRLAFDELDGRDGLTIGPSDDGGFYALGLRELHAALFAGMTYSHDRVLEDTLARADGLALTLLPPWYDVDDAAALNRLRADLLDDPDAAPRTRAWLAGWTPGAT